MATGMIRRKFALLGLLPFLAGKLRAQPSATTLAADLLKCAEAAALLGKQELSLTISALSVSVGLEDSLHSIISKSINNRRVFISMVTLPPDTRL